jgi:hypothetical protein
VINSRRLIALPDDFDSRAAAIDTQPASCLFANGIGHNLRDPGIIVRVKSLEIPVTGLENRINTDRCHDVGSGIMLKPWNEYMDGYKPARRTYGKRRGILMTKPIS